jgi:hypothetical protein
MARHLCPASPLIVSQGLSRTAVRVLETAHCVYRCDIQPIFYLNYGPLESEAVYFHRNIPTLRKKHFGVEMYHIEDGSNRLLRNSGTYLPNNSTSIERAGLAITLSTLIQMVLGLNLERNSSYPRIFVVFLSFSMKVPG